jgi:phage major head subunit gpT-like protein/phage head maturation protease
MAKRTSAKMIRAAKAKPKDVIEPSALRILATASVDIQAAKGDGARPTFEIIGYTGAVMQVEGFFNPVVVDLAGVKTTGQQIPALFSHDLDRVVGLTSSVKIASEITLAGIITGDNEWSAEVVSQAKNGFRWQASIGATIVRREFLDAGKTATVNGREVAGPLVIAREAQLYEISFVSVGADSQTSADVAASLPTGSLKGTGTMNPFEEWLKAKGIDPAALEDPVRATLQAAYDKETAAPKPDPRKTETLEDITARRRKEEERVKEITRIADAAMEERPALLGEFEIMAKAAIEKKDTTVKDFELEVLRASRDCVAVGTLTRKGDQRTGVKVIEAAVCLAGGLKEAEKHFDEKTLNIASERFPNGIGLCELFMMAARENGFTGHSAREVRPLLEHAFGRNIRAGGFSTNSLPGILSNTANKFLTSGFSAVESTWRDIAARRPVNDFKQITTYALTGGFMYEKVGPAGELKHAQLGELTYTSQVETYGRMFAITRQDLINDDLGALSQIPRKLGRGAALKLNDVFWTVFMNNSAFFTSGRANLMSGAGSVLGIAGLTTGEALFMNQTDPDGLPVAIMPQILLVPNAVFTTANNLMNSTEIRDTTVNQVSLTNNPHAGKYRVVRSSYLSNTAYTGNSTTAWYLLADPNDLATVEVAFLNGRETPIVESADADFDTLGVQFRGYFDFGVGMQEYRAGIKSAGA